VAALDILEALVQEIHQTRLHLKEIMVVTTKPQTAIISQAAVAGVHLRLGETVLFLLEALAAMERHRLSRELLLLAQVAEVVAFMEAVELVALEVLAVVEQVVEAMEVLAHQRLGQLIQVAVAVVCIPRRAQAALV
jgi:hypothetical protein